MPSNTSLHCISHKNENHMRKSTYLPSLPPTYLPTKTYYKTSSLTARMPVRERASRQGQDAQTSPETVDDAEHCRASIGA